MRSNDIPQNWTNELETRIRGLSLSGIIPSKAGTLAVARASLAVFIGWLGVVLAQFLMSTEFVYPAEQVSTTAHYVHAVMTAAGGVQYYASIATPLVLFVMLDLPRGRRLLSALLAGAVVAMPFHAVAELRRPLEHAFAARMQPDLLVYVTGFADGLLNGFGVTLLFGFMVTVPFFLATWAAEHVTNDEYTNV